MAIYSLRMTNIKRSDGRSAVGASAYRARANLKDDRTGKSYSYSFKQDLLFNQIYSHIDLPKNMTSLYQVWNKAEEAEKRVNSVVAREFLIALPKELTGQQNIKLTEEIAKTLCQRFEFVAQASIHSEKDDEKGNIHLHLLTTTRKIAPDGFKEKIRELDTIRNTEALTEVRETVSNIINKHLELNSINQKVDHRRLDVQREEVEKNNNIEKVIELSRLPQIHIGKKKSDENKQRNEEIVKINNELRDEMRLIYFPKLLLKNFKKVKKYVSSKKNKTIFQIAKSLGVIVKPMSKKKLRKIEERNNPKDKEQTQKEEEYFFPSIEIKEPEPEIQQRRKLKI